MGKALIKEKYRYDWRYYLVGYASEASRSYTWQCKTEVLGYADAERAFRVTRMITHCCSWYIPVLYVCTKKKNFTVPSCVNNFTILTSLKRWTSRVTTMQWQLWSSIQCLKSRVCKAEALPLFFNRKYWSRTQAFLTQVNWIVVHSYKFQL
jgi:hypothetical protein